MLKIGVTAALVCLAIAPVQAGQKYRAMAMAGVPACVAVQEIPPILYPAPDWEPFFRRHLYVAPVVTCNLVASQVQPVSGQVISVRY